MPFGDVGGPVTELVITMLAWPDAQIKEGDAVALCANWTVTNEIRYTAPVLGQAMAAPQPGNDGRPILPVKVRGVARFKAYCSPVDHFTVGDSVRMCAQPGSVIPCGVVTGPQVVLAVHKDEVDVLL